jgi:acyl carrier protein
MAKETADILKELEHIFSDVLEKPDVRLTADTTAQDIEEWDSLTHIQLIVAIEKHFKARFTAAQIQSWKNVGAMCQALQEKLN